MDHQSQILTLRDGRKLGFGEWGDQNGKAVLFFSGSNNARLSRHPDESILIELGIHLFTFDRPGMGLSAPQPYRRLLDWADDVRDFAGQRQIVEFAVIGASGGGPYTLACAYTLPDLVTSATIASGVSPMPPTLLRSLPTPIRLMTFMARHATWALTAQNNILAFFVKRGDSERLLRRSLNMLPASDQRVLDMPGLSSILVQDVLESVRQGGRGAALDMGVFTAPDWGFRLEDIRTRVFIWQGEDDPNATPAMAAYMVERIPDAELKLLPDTGHMLVYGRWREILQQVLEY